MNSFTAPLDYMIEAEPLWSTLDSCVASTQTFSIISGIDIKSGIICNTTLTHNAENW